MNDIEKAIEYFYIQMENGNIQNDEQQEVFEIAIYALEKQLKDGWIPVSERLPEKQQRALVTLKHAPIVVGWLMWDEWYTDYGKGYGDVEVIAWQPLPQPYKEAN